MQKETDKCVAIRHPVPEGRVHFVVFPKKDVKTTFTWSRVKMKTAVRKTTAVILSGVFPGLGQLYNREFFKAALFVVPSVGLSWLVTRAVSVDPLALIERGASRTVMLAMVVLLAIWLWSVVDAWRSAG